MRMTIAAAALVLVTGGCTTREERLASWRERCTRDYGLAAGTEAHGQCVMRLEISRERSIDAALAAPAPVVPAPQPIYIPPVYVPR